MSREFAGKMVSFAIRLLLMGQARLDFPSFNVLPASCRQMERPHAVPAINLKSPLPARCRQHVIRVSFPGVPCRILSQRLEGQSAHEL